MAIPAFREGGIFRDIDSIQVGADFVAAMRAAVGFADVVVAVIGADWLSAAGARGRRLDDPGDAVRVELVEALTAGVPVVPVLVRDARMPRAEDLPAPLAPLVTRNAIEVSDARFDHDVERLVDALFTAAASSRRGRQAAPEKPTPGPYYEMGEAYLQQSDFVNAKRCMQAAIAAHPDSTQARFGLARALQGEAQGQITAMNYGIAADLLAEGEAAALEALRADDTDTDVQVQLGYLRKEIAQNYLASRNRRAAREALERARASFEMALGRDPDHVSALNGLANVAQIEGDYPRAIVLGRRVMRLHPRYTYAVLDLAIAYQESAKHADGPRRLRYARALRQTCRHLIALEADDEAAALPADVRDQVRRMLAWAEAVLAERTSAPRRR